MPDDLDLIRKLEVKLDKLSAEKCTAETLDILLRAQKLLREKKLAATQELIQQVENLHGVAKDIMSYVSEAAGITRASAATLIRDGHVAVDGRVIVDTGWKIGLATSITLYNKEIKHG